MERCDAIEGTGQREPAPSHILEDPTNLVLRTIEVLERDNGFDHSGGNQIERKACKACEEHKVVIAHYLAEIPALPLGRNE